MLLLLCIHLLPLQKFSIILPVHNGGEYIKECVSSILSQTLQDFNLIVLDNASTDGTLEWVRSLNDIRIISYTSEKFLSIEENWARITDIPKNEFITLIGHDDILNPDFLEVINHLINSDSEASLYHTHFNYIDAKAKIIRPCKTMNKELSSDALLKKILTKDIDIMGTGYVMRSADYDNINGIPVHYPSLLFADLELWHKMASLKYELIDPRNCFCFRIHQSTTGKASDQRLHSALEIFIKYLSGIQRESQSANTIIHANAASFLFSFCKAFCHRLLRTPLEDRAYMTIGKTISFFEGLAFTLGVKSNFNPRKILSLKLAIIIDNNKLFRNSFLFAKKIYNKPILK